MRIEDQYIRHGYFWLPDNSDHKIPGILTINNGGHIELEIIGVFGENSKSFNDDDDIDKIIGHIEKDGLVTLERCFYTNKNISFGGISKSKIFANRVLSGVAYNKDEKANFNSLSFSIDCLDEWIGISGISIDLQEDTSTISYTPPKNIIYQLSNGMQLEICFSYTFPHPEITEVKITQQAYLKLTSETLRPLSDFTKTAYKLTMFMCFATDTTVTLKNLCAKSSEIKSKDETLIPIKIFYQSIPFSEKKPDQPWRKMLFNYQTIKDNAGNIFNNWINAYYLLGPAINLYFSTTTGAHKYLESRFLALAQGLETYHRRTSNEKQMNEEKFDALVSNLIKTCPADSAEWLQGRLRHGNEINLRKRLQRIIEPFKNHLGNCGRRSKLLKNIVDTRNYLTHYDQTLKADSLEGDELLTLCQKIEIIFQLHFLKVIGFSNSEIDDAAKTSTPLKRKIKIILSN